MLSHSSRVVNIFGKLTAGAPESDVLLLNKLDKVLENIHPVTNQENPCDSNVDVCAVIDNAPLEGGYVQGTSSIFSRVSIKVVTLFRGEFKNKR